MRLKSIEKSNNGIKIRLVVVTFLIAGGIIFNAAWISRKNTNKENVLGNESERKKITVTPIEEKVGDWVDGAVSKTEETAGSVLGELTQTVIDIATQSAKKATDFVFDSTVGNVVKQVEKLPEKQQEEIKKEICK